MLITISGLPGSGKSTVGKLLAKKLRCPVYSIGAMRRALARERGMTLEEYNQLGETQAFTDRDIDDWQAKHARTLQQGIFEGRTSFYFIPQSFKVFLEADAQTAAKRIAADRSSARHFEAQWHDVPGVHRALKRRVTSDIKRYRKYYHLNIFSRRHYDLILDTSHLSPAGTVKEIMRRFQAYQAAVDGRGRTKRLSTGSKHAVNRKLTGRRSAKISRKSSQK